MSVLTDGEQLLDLLIGVLRELGRPKTKAGTGLIEKVSLLPDTGVVVVSMYWTDTGEFKNCRRICGIRCDFSWQDFYGKNGAAVVDLIQDRRKGMTDLAIFFQRASADSEQSPIRPQVACPFHGIEGKECGSPCDKNEIS